MTIMWHTDEPGTSVVEYERTKELGWSIYTGKPEPAYPEYVYWCRLVFSANPGTTGEAWLDDVKITECT